METRIIMANRFSLLTYNDVNIGYRKLPADTSFTISKKINNGSWEEIDSIDCAKDTDRNIF